MEGGNGVFAEFSQAGAGLGCLCLATAAKDSERNHPWSAFLLLQVLPPTPGCAAALVHIRAAVVFC